MRDYTYRDPNGREMTVSQMKTSDIIDCLRDGFEEEDREATREAITERLRLELQIRAIGP